MYSLQISYTNSADYSKPFAMKNHHEVLRCYDVLVRSHKEKLIAGLVVRMGSVDENIRLASLTIFKVQFSISLSLIHYQLSLYISRACDYLYQMYLPFWI